jgi:hypothetical protein
MLVEGDDHTSYRQKNKNSRAKRGEEATAANAGDLIRMHPGRPSSRAWRTYKLH